MLLHCCRDMCSCETPETLYYDLKSGLGPLHMFLYTTELASWHMWVKEQEKKKNSTTRGKYLLVLST